MRHALVLSFALALAGCTATPPAPETVHCMKCRRSVSADSVVCTDCAAPTANPVVVVEMEDKAPPPPHRPPRKTDAPPSSTTPAARRAPTEKDARVLFLNRFPQADSDAVEQELMGLQDFVDVTPGGGAAGRRVAIEFKYVGPNLKRDLVAVMRKLGFKFHFTEAKLQEHVELVKD